MSNEGCLATIAVICILLAAFGIAVVAGQQSSGYDKSSVCQFVHGKMHGDVCIKDGRVVKVTP